ncbi:LptF/LptG family permease [Planctomycetota bacterium]
MKILDRYVVKNFLIGYAISFGVLIGLRVIMDLFVNLDEFTENIDRLDLSSLDVAKNILVFYALNVTLYFRDFAGMITVVAAAFSLGKMVRTNELVAVMASGVSLKRVIAPIVFLALLFTGLLVIDQEVLIPAFSDKLVRSHDSVPGEESYDVWFIGDSEGSLICSQRFDVKTSTLLKPTIIIREKQDGPVPWNVTGWIEAPSAAYDEKADAWMLKDGKYHEKDSLKPVIQINSYSSDLTARDIPIRRKSRNKSMLSWIQLRELASQKSQTKDIAQLFSQMHFHATEPIINFVMLMLCLPVLVCRDPKEMKSAIMASFTMVGVCFLTTFICKLLSTEPVFGRMFPQFWSWLPVFIFAPVAFMKIDSMKT